MLDKHLTMAERARDILEPMWRTGVCPIVAHKNSVDLLMRRPYQLGCLLREFELTTLEVAYRDKSVFEQADKFIPDLQRAGIRVGFGTIFNAQEAQHFIDLGADFIVSPGFGSDISNTCGIHDMLYIPGVKDSTQIMAAIADGWRVLKYFPAQNQAEFKALADPFGRKQLTFIASGLKDSGDENDLKGWYKHPAIGAIVHNSTFFPKKKIETTKDWDMLQAHMSALLTKVAKMRGSAQ